MDPEIIGYWIGTGIGVICTIIGVLLGLYILLKISQFFFGKKPGFIIYLIAMGTFMYLVFIFVSDTFLK